MPASFLDKGCKRTEREGDEDINIATSTPEDTEYSLSNLGLANIKGITGITPQFYIENKFCWPAVQTALPQNLTPESNRDSQFPGDECFFEFFSATPMGIPLPPDITVSPSNTIAPNPLNLLDSSTNASSIFQTLWGTYNDPLSVPPNPTLESKPQSQFLNKIWETQVKNVPKYVPNSTNEKSRKSREDDHPIYIHSAGTEHRACGEKTTPLEPQSCETWLEVPRSKFGPSSSRSRRSTSSILSSVPSLDSHSSTSASRSESLEVSTPPESFRWEFLSPNEDLFEEPYEHPSCRPGIIAKDRREGSNCLLRSKGRKLSIRIPTKPELGRPMMGGDSFVASPQDIYKGVTPIRTCSSVYSNIGDSDDSWSGPLTSPGPGAVRLSHDRFRSPAPIPEAKFEANIHIGGSSVTIDTDPARVRGGDTCSISGPNTRTQVLSRLGAQACFPRTPLSRYRGPIHSPITPRLDEGYSSMQPTGIEAMAWKDHPESEDSDIETPESLGSPESPKAVNISPPLINLNLPLSFDPEDRYSGYREEKAVKITALYILTQYFLLREYHLKSQSASTTPSSKSSTSTEGCTDPQIDPCENLDNQNENGDSSIKSGEGIGSVATELQNNQTQQSTSGGNPRKRKRIGNSQGDKNNDDEDDRDDQQPNKKRSKHVDINSLGSRLACPFSKGKPSSHLSCALIGRQDLAGVKEHLKRNHFNKKLPQEIRNCKTWEQVFLVCNPTWGLKAIPSRFLDIGYELVQMIADIPLPEISPLDDETPANPNGATNPTNAAAFSSIGAMPQTTLTMGQQTAGIGAILPSNSPPLAQVPHGESQNIIGNTNTQYNIEPVYKPIRGDQIPTSQAFNEMIKSRAVPHIMWPPGPEFAEAFGAVPGQIFQNYGVNMNSPPTEVYTQLQQDLNTNSFMPYPGTFPNNPPLPLYSQRGNNPSAPSVSPNSSIYTPALTQGRSETSITTPVHTFPQPIADLTSNVYTLMVARKNPAPDSTEEPGPKQFDFDSYETFKTHFEPWMSATFTDPPFSWEMMEFLGADPSVTSRLSTMNQVLMDIRMYHMRYRTKDATLHLVWKDKGKQRMSF
ncbi:hypothetical protein TWF730_010002 [Orbilia blumenaviensis]|uniref:Uncharacterized protein n=1 Tax=Orbilia blumenaviensis TaxID=1796055 RepID=A0AAV9UWW3_9PEZI